MIGMGGTTGMFGMGRGMGWGNMANMDGPEKLSNGGGAMDIMGSMQNMGAVDYRNPAKSAGGMGMMGSGGGIGGWGGGGWGGM